MSRLLAGPNATPRKPPQPSGAGRFLAPRRAARSQKNPGQGRAVPRCSQLQKLEEERETEGNRREEGAILLMAAHW